jgi:hypothetical protein
MALEMRPSCERCSAPLAATAEAFICSYECTFCKDCAAEMHSACPNCSNELVQRPRKVKACEVCETSENAVK